MLHRYEQTRGLGSGNNQPALNKRIVQGIPLPLPPVAEQEVLVEAVEGQLSVIAHLETQADERLRASLSLRQAILLHAFAGRLVPQDPNDEPVSMLIERIAAERAARAADGAIRSGTRRKGTRRPRPRRPQAS
jgi:type I restriction enzyme S subunit